MKTSRNILVAFLLNLSFSVLEFFGGLFTHSVAILSDSVHDLGDALSIGISYFLEKKSKKKPDDTFTFGYARFSVLGGLITVLILTVGSVLVIANAIRRILSPAEINYDAMLLFAVFGVVLNFVAALITREGDSINQRAVNLHMLEDVLGWLVVLVGAIVMRLTDFALLDPILSIAVSLFILWNALKELKRIADLYLEKTPEGISVEELKTHLCEIDGVKEVHHIHLWSLDGYDKIATMHIVTDAKPEQVKASVREELAEHGIRHATLELESLEESCEDKICHPAEPHEGHHHHHHGM